MTKLVIFALLFNTILSAIEVTQSQQNTIYMEAILFVGIFGTMGLISYIYSSRHAKAYKPKKVPVVEVVAEETVGVSRISELSEMLKNGILTKEEFELLNNYHLQS